MGARTNGFGTLTPLPNEVSPHRTTASVYFDHHYARLDLLGRWTWERFARLCQFLKVTPHELASLAMIPHKRIEWFQRHNHLGGNQWVAQAFILTVIEARVLRNWSKDIIEEPFPSFAEASQTS